MWVFWGRRENPPHLTTSSFTDLHSRGKSQGKGSGFICGVMCPGLDGQDKTSPGPRGSRFQAEGPGPIDPALGEGPELSNARVELGHPLPCQAVSRTEPRLCWGWSCPTLWASSFLSPQLLAFFLPLACPHLPQALAKHEQEFPENEMCCAALSQPWAVIWEPKGLLQSPIGKPLPVFSAC